MVPCRKLSRTGRGRGRGYDRHCHMSRLPSVRHNAIQPQAVSTVIAPSSSVHNSGYDASRIQQLIADNDDHNRQFSQLIVEVERIQLFQAFNKKSIRYASDILRKRQEQDGNLNYNFHLLSKVLEIDLDFERFKRYYEAHGHVPDKTVLERCMESDAKRRLLMPQANQQIGRRRIEEFEVWLMSL